MIRRASGPAVLAVSLLLVSCAQAPPPAPAAAPAPAVKANEPDDLAAIARLRDAYSSALGAGDATAMANLYTEDGISQTNQMPTMTGRAAIEEGQKMAFSQASFSGMEVTAEETRTLGNIGYERGRFKMTVTPKAGGKPMPQEGRYMLVLQKGPDGMWRVARDMDNVDVPPGPARAN